MAASTDFERPLGKFQLSTIANMDQTPLPFNFNGGQGYNKSGGKTVWHRASGLDKCQCTIQLTISADGEVHVPPLLIFTRKGLRLSHTEKINYNQGVKVQFQENVWCNEDQLGEPHVEKPI